MQMKIYLDNCSYNRPYDDQSQIRISLETQAKIYIQDMIKNSELELVTSYVLDYENDQNRFEEKRKSIGCFMDDYSSYYVGIKHKKYVRETADKIMKTGVKEKDAAHIACALLAGCEYFITTDDRLLKYENDRIGIVTPVEFLRKIGV